VPHHDGLGFIVWMLDGVIHRDYGPAEESESGCGEKVWYSYGKIHREGAPAIIRKNNEGEVWYHQGLCHREDGPALTDESGKQHHYLKGERVKKEDFEKWRLNKSEAVMIQDNE
jgi:hypothetical protein